MTVLLVDNYDSFTFNLFQCLGGLGATTRVDFNDRLSVDEVQAIAPSHIVLSPGPGRPERAEDFGVCRPLIEAFTDTPILGVCLGHQGIVDTLGGDVVGAPTVVHGKTSDIDHDDRGLFEGLPRPLRVMRYHSLVVDAETLPDCLEVSARLGDLVMGVRHRTRPLVGVQFHPESIGTPDGPALIANFLRM